MGAWVKVAQEKVAVVEAKEAAVEAGKTVTVCWCSRWEAARRMCWGCRDSPHAADSSCNCRRPPRCAGRRSPGHPGRHHSAAAAAAAAAVTSHQQLPGSWPAAAAVAACLVWPAYPASLTCRLLCPAYLPACHLLSAAVACPTHHRGWRWRNSCYCCHCQPHHDPLSPHHQSHHRRCR